MGIKRIITGLACGVWAFAGAALAQSGPAVDAGMRARVVEGTAQQIETYFYDSATATQIAAELRAALSQGRFDDARDAGSLAVALTGILEPYDRHFGVQYFGPPPEQNASSQAAPGSGGVFAAGARDNFGFREVSVLPGNIGYIDVRLFYPVQTSGETAIAALNFIGNSDAVIFDMRHHRGGTPAMVQFLVSHFLDPNMPVTINTFLAGGREYPGELTSLAWLPAGARPDVPLFILTSGQTASAGEAFPYHLQAMGRATVIGETTFGAGNPGGFFPAGDGFAVFIAVNQSRNPITGTNWEGTGVVPDIAVSADAALDTALVEAYSAILETADDPVQRQSLEWAREEIEARLDPPVIALGEYADIAGTYGPRTLFEEGGAILYRRGDQGGRQLTPVSRDRFLVEGLDNYRLTVQRDGNGRVTSITLQQAGGPPDVSPRS